MFEHYSICLESLFNSCDGQALSLIYFEYPTFSLHTVANKNKPLMLLQRHVHVFRIDIARLSISSQRIDLFPLFYIVTSMDGLCNDIYHN